MRWILRRLLLLEPEDLAVFWRVSPEEVANYHPAQVLPVAIAALGLIMALILCAVTTKIRYDRRHGKA